MAVPEQLLFRRDMANRSGGSGTSFLFLLLIWVGRMRGVSKVNSGFDCTIREMFGLSAGGRVRFENDYEGRSQNRGEGLNMENPCLEADLMATRPSSSTRQTRYQCSTPIQSIVFLRQTKLLCLSFRSFLSSCTRYSKTNGTNTTDLSIGGFIGRCKTAFASVKQI